VVSGTSATLENLETSFHQDLNGDGTLGIPSVNTALSEKTVDPAVISHLQAELTRDFHF